MSDVNDGTTTDPRAIRGAEIAERFRVRQDGDHWIVPSQSGDGRYSVYPDEGPHSQPASRVTRLPQKSVARRGF